jgi:hypothetical protein
MKNTPRPTVFLSIAKDIAKPPVETMISLSISTDKTVVWVDHWEDGYDLDVVAGASSTEVWGDGDASNGCAPDVKLCVNNNDYLMAGRSIVIQNTVEILPRNKDHIRYDGGDIIKASLPIAVIRAAFPTVPGSEMAGSGKCQRPFVARVELVCESCTHPLFLRIDHSQWRCWTPSCGVPSLKLLLV